MGEGNTTVSADTIGIYNSIALTRHVYFDKFRVFFIQSSFNCSIIYLFEKRKLKLLELILADPHRIV